MEIRTFSSGSKQNQFCSGEAQLEESGKGLFFLMKQAEESHSTEHYHRNEK